MTKMASFGFLFAVLFATGLLGCTGSQMGGGGQESGAGGTPGVIASGGMPGIIAAGGSLGVSGVAGRPSVIAAGGAGGIGLSTCATGVFTGVAGSRGVSSPGLMISPEFAPQLGTTSSQLVAPPAISGGTLLVLSDGKTVVASDPDRDAIYVVDLPSRTLTQTIALQPGDEPGRLVEDGAGRVHIALRGAGAVVTCDPGTGTLIGRRPVCAGPRGLAYDTATDRVHVACHDGQLVSLPAAGGDPDRRLRLDEDLRDVVVDADTLLVTRFRSAELLKVGSDGSVTGRTQLPNFTSPQVHQGSRYTPSVAWRTLPVPGGGVVVLHQRGMVDPVVAAPGGYGGPNACDTIVHGCISRIDRDGTTRTGPALASLVLAIDMALSPDGTQVAVVAAGNATNTDAAVTSTTTPALTRVFLTDLDDATDPKVGCSMDGKHAPCPKGRMSPIAPGFTGVGGARGTVASGGTVGAGGDVGPAGTAGLCCAPGGVGTAGGAAGAGGAIGAGGVGGFAHGGAGGSATVCPSATPGVPVTVGQPIAVAFDGSGGLIVQSREPAMLAFGDGTTISLSTVSRADTGHTLFHANSGGFLACASCHAEGNEDGRTWNFSCEGPRRTQSLQVGLAGTEPFHWDGSETDFGHLTTDVFQGRMSGPALASAQQGALLTWLDSQPRLPKPYVADPTAVLRGQVLFQDPAHGCAICHAGPHMTNSQTVDVGTGGRFQVPSLIGVGNRAPYMHDGCAPTLADRFGACGGGDQHGVTSTLSAGDISDLVAYLKTL